MKIVTRKDNNTVICYGNDVAFTHCLVSPIVALDLTEENTNVFDVDNIPEFFIAGLMQYENNQFVITDGELYKEAFKDEFFGVITSKIQKRLDDFAKTRNYDGILSACTYATSTSPMFASESQQCVSLRDATWTKLYQVLAEVEAGTRPIPNGYADIEAELPELVWVE